MSGPKRLLALAMLMAVAGATACRSADDGVATTLAERDDRWGDPRSAPLPPLPDLDAMAVTVQEQIRAERAALERTVQTEAPTDADLARAFGVMGQLLMAAESVAAAEPYFVWAGRLEPNVPRWPYYLGHLHRLQGKLELAGAYFERALALDPRDVAALVWLGRVRLDEGRADEAARFYTRALDERPGLFAALFGLGRAALVRGANDEAVGHLEAALAAEPRASAVHYPLALAYRGLGRTAEAESHLRARGDAQPAPPDPLMEEVAGLLRSAVIFEGRGDRALTRGDMPAAVEAFRQALALSPDRRALKQKLATSLALAGDVPAALDLYQALLDEDPNFAEAHYSLGALLAGSGRLEPAIERFAAAVRADPTYLQARLQLAHALRRAGRAESALVVYQDALAIDPRLAEARLGYAVTLAGLRRWGTARAWLAEGRRTHPSELAFSELLIRLLAAAPDANVRDGEQAVGLARALAAQSPSWRVTEALAMALAETGRYEEAERLQGEAMTAYQRDTGRPSAAMAETRRLYAAREPSRVPWSFDPIG